MFWTTLSIDNDSDDVDIKYIYWILKIRKVISPPYIISFDIFNSYLQKNFLSIES